MLKIFFQFKAQYIKTQMEYTANFWMMVFSGILMRTLMTGVVFVLFRNIPDIAGWREGELYLILGFMCASEGMTSIFVDGIWHLPALVFQGGLDVMLVRPISPLFQILSYEIGLQGIGVVIMGILNIGMGLASLGRLDIFSILLCALFVLLGTVLRLSYNLIAASAVFWANGARTNATFLVYSVGEYAKYPVSIYPGWMQFILMAVIPAGFVGFVPALILRGDHAVPYMAALLAVTGAYFLISRTVFYRGIRKYESMGM